MNEDFKEFMIGTAWIAFLLVAVFMAINYLATTCN